VGTILSKKQIKKQVKDFLKDKSQKKLEIEVPKNFSINWIRNPVSVWFRKVFLAILSKVPPMHVKTGLVAMMGYRFEHDVCLPGFIGIDPYFPELITLKRGVLVGGLSTIKPWTVDKGKLTLGRIVCEKRVLLAGWTTLLPGAHVNENTITGVKSVITEEIPKDSFVIRNNKVIKTWSKEEVERHFGHSKHDPKYARKVKKLTDDFRRDKEKRLVRFRNDGSRLNAGCDWWRARPVWQIYWNGLWMELNLLMPFQPMRKLCLWIMGVRWGKNFKLGKKVTFDHIYGDTIRIGNNVSIGDYTFMDGHEYTASETVYGKTIVRNNVKIGKRCWVRGGATIGDHAVIKNDSDIMKDVGEKEIWQGSPAKLVEDESGKD